MTKTDLIKWLEDERRKALKNAEKRYEKEMEAYTKELYEKIQLDKHAEQIFKLCKQLDSAFDELKNALTTDVVFCEEFRDSLPRILRSFPDFESTKEELATYLFDRAERKKSIYRRFNELAKNINENYDSVLLNVKNIKNAKLGVQYLESLGFKDINAKEKEEESTAVACVVNTDFLFVREELK